MRHIKNIDVLLLIRHLFFVRRISPEGDALDRKNGSKPQKLRRHSQARSSGHDEQCSRESRSRANIG